MPHRVICIRSLHCIKQGSDRQSGRHRSDKRLLRDPPELACKTYHVDRQRQTADRQPAVVLYCVTCATVHIGMAHQACNQANGVITAGLLETK